jgi:integrase
MDVQGCTRYSFRTVPYETSSTVPDLSRKRVRERLPIRREPYWQRLSEGAYLGFRRGPDTWLARYRGRDRKQQYQPLKGVLDFDQAKQQAEYWLGQLAGTAVRVIRRDTVRAALESYLTDLRRQGRPDAACEAQGRFRRVVWNDPIADLHLEDATVDDFLEWRDRIREGRQARTINRNVRAVRAGLNRARQLGHMGKPEAWMFDALADDVEDDGATAVILSAEQRRALITAASPGAADFLKGLELTGARPKELAAAKVSDFDGEAVRLAHRKGRPAKLRVRHVVLSAEGVAFFKRMAKGKFPAAPLFTEDGEQTWRRHIWAREVRAAIEAHNANAKPKDQLPKGIGAYAIRHARISELLQIHGIDPLTVAQQTGTSLAMIEKSYLKFIPSAMREKLEAVKEIG